MKDKLIDFIKRVWLNRHFKLIMIALVATLPILLYRSVPVSHDILFHLSRIDGILYEIETGNIFSFIYHNFLNNLGYASPLFYSDIFLYPFALLYKILNLSLTYKILMFCLNIATVYTIDFVLRKFNFNSKTVMFGTIIYTFSSYRMVDMYSRGCLGESLSFIFLPLVILGIYEIIYGDKKKYYYLVVGMCGIIYSHVISTFLVGIFILFYLLLNIKRLFSEKRYLYFLLTIFITFLLTSSFLIPLLEQLIDRNFYIHYLQGINDFNNVRVPIYLLFLEFPLPSEVWYPLGIGIIYLYFIYLGMKYRKSIEYKNWIWLILGILFLISSTSLLPRFIYEKFLYLIQFQWRFYMLATISLFFFGINLIEKISYKQTKLINNISFISMVIVLTSMTVNNLIYNKVEKIDREYLVFYEYLPNGINVEDVINNNIVASSNNDIIFEHHFDKDKVIVTYSKNVYNDSIITIPLLYYKGYVSNKNYDIINNNGLLGIKLEKESDEVVIYYNGTNIAYISRIISFITIILLISYYIRKKGLNGKVESGI